MADKSGPRPDWRNRNAGGQSPAAGGRDWRGDKHAAAGAARRSHRATIITVLAVLLVLTAGAFAWFLYKPEPLKPVCLALLGAGYEENLALPHNAYGMLGLKELDAASANTHLLKLRPVKNLISKQVWEEEWGKIHKETREDTLVLFLALHGMADDSDAYLLFDDAAGGTKLPLTELLSNLANLNKKVLLILEPALAGAYWPAGIVHNDFVARLKDPKTVLGKNVVVLCASDAGQTSWVSEERGQTIFNYFLIEGLRKKALITGSNRISVADLYDDVKKQVADWAWHNRAAVQTPILLGSAETKENLKLIPLTRDADDKDAPEKVAEAPKNPFVPSVPLKSLWAQTAELAQAVPSPAVYTPQRWRFYRDMGVRYEQLERAGYPADDLARLKGVLNEAATKMRNDARCDEAAACLGWTLPMHAVLGFRAPLDDKKAEAGLHDLQLELAGDGKNKNKVFAAVVKQVPGGDATAKKLVRGQLQRALLSKVAWEIDPQTLKETWQEVRKVVDFLDDGDRPAETHLLVMLLQDLDREHSPGAELLKKVLAVRRQAEEAALAPAKLRAHPYSEAVFTRVRPAIKEADQLRRTGEDRLFASGTKDHERGNADLTKAAEGYKQAQSEAAILRAALDMRDRGLADLPYFAWWVAIQREPRQDLGRWENHTKDLAKCLKDIAADLDDPKKLDHLAEATSKARLAYAELGKALRDELLALEKALDEQEHWHQIEAALALPIGVGVVEESDAAKAAKNREALLNKSGHISRRWFDQESRPRDVAADAKPVQKKDRQEAMVSAALQPYEVLPDRRVPAVEDVRAAMAPSNEEENRLKNALSNLDPDAARNGLKRVDFLWRRLPVTQRMLNQVGQVDQASRVLRGLRLVDLLVWQAERTGRDHWFAEEATKEYPGFLGKPYYQMAAQAYLDAAAQLAKQRIDNRKLQEAIVTMLAEKSATFDKANALYQMQGPNLLWAGVQDHTLQWKIAKDEGNYLEPFGVPVAWLAQLQGAKVTGAQTGRSNTFVPYERLTLEALGPPRNEKGETVEFKLARAKEDNASGKVKGEFAVLYRGAKLKKSVTIESPEPDLIVRNELPVKDPEVAVQAHGSNAAVCIVLDCSPSMKWPHGGAGKSRFKWATEALRTTLSRIPEGTGLSVYAMIYPHNRVIRAASRWEAIQRNDLIDRIADLENDIKGGFSPIADALVNAKEKGFRSEWKGLKVLVALTDGDDNWSGVVRKEMDEWNPNLPGPLHETNTKIVQHLMRDNFDNQKENCEVHIVCFIDRVKDADEFKRATAQFGIVTDFSPLPGTFRTESDGKKLAEGLAQAIRPKLYLHRGGKIKKIAATYDGEHYRFEPILPDVSYTPDFSERLKEQPVIATKGDKLLIEIAAIGLRRALVTAKVRERQQKIDEIISVPEHQWDKDGRLSQLITIEDKDTKVLEHRRPAFVWIETAPAPGKTPKLVTWQPAYYRTAPAFKLEAVAWPSDKQAGNVVAAPAKTQVWWSADAPAGPMLKRVPIALGALQPVIVGGAEIQIDVIERSLPIKPGEPPSKCLEVRLSYPPAKRFRVEIAPQLLAEEHRYFTADGRLTALFWIENGRVPPELRIIDVSAFLETLPSATFNLSGTRSDPLLGE